MSSGSALGLTGMPIQDRAHAVRTSYAAYRANDRRTAEGLRTDDFRFSSPVDVDLESISGGTCRTGLGP